MAAGVDTKMGEVTSSEKEFHEGEPVFVIRAQDPLATQAIMAYRDICINNGCNTAHIDAIENARDAVDNWQTDNDELVKDRPDS